jgi:LPXTG-motif cell wall-anchored protein
MLEVTSSEPALWRMQVLEDWDGRGWGFVRNRDPLPEPRAVEVTTKVRIVGLSNRLIAAPGRIDVVEGDTPSESSRGESWRLEDSPSQGDTYTVKSEVVHATADELAQVKIPTSDMYDPYTRFWPRRSRSGERPVTRLAGHLNGWLQQSPWGDAILLAHRLSSGSDSQLEVVRRVEDYLTGGHFRYTTDVKEPGSDPLFEFLFETRAGYCQHFAGAAALLLRLAGVPTRVVSGFATGKRTGETTYTVRDEDAHAWIEVYFPGYGWVPFNPTPSAAEADVAPETDVLAAASAGGGINSGTPAAALIGIAVAGLGAAVLFLRRRRSTIAVGEVLARLTPEPVGPSTTLSALRPRLAAIGPSVAALAEQAERARFAADGTAEPARPYLRVWRALSRDVGAWRATRSILRAAR